MNREELGVSTTEHVILKDGQEIGIYCRWIVSVLSYNQPHGEGSPEPTCERGDVKLDHWEVLSSVPDGSEAEIKRLVKTQSPAWAEEVSL